MNTTVRDEAKKLELALKTVAQQVLTDPGAALSSFPAAVIGPPRLRFESGCVSPTSAQFPVYVVIEAGEHALEQLWLLVPDVSAAIDEHTGGVVVSADPFPYGEPPLPSYQVIVEVTL